jgi:hypothetical protein
LRDGRILAAIHCKSAGNAPDRCTACWPKSSKRLGAFDSRLRFRKFHTSSQLQIQK